MRAISYILAVVIAVLATCPCADTSARSTKAGYSISSVESSSAQDDARHTVDLCTPFCVCNCCSSQVNQPTVFTYQLASPDYPSHNLMQPTGFVKSIYQSIWQPPKIS